MNLPGKKLGILVSASPDQKNFDHAMHLAASALKQGVAVYIYCIDEAVHGLDDPRLVSLRLLGAKNFACAFGMQLRNLSLSSDATLSGLGLLHDVIVSTDRFVSFN